MQSMAARSAAAAYPSYKRALASWESEIEKIRESNREAGGCNAAVTKEYEKELARWEQVVEQQKVVQNRRTDFDEENRSIRGAMRGAVQAIRIRQFEEQHQLYIGLEAQIQQAKGKAINTKLNYDIQNSLWFFHYTRSNRQCNIRM